MQTIVQRGILAVLGDRGNDGRLDDGEVDIMDCGTGSVTVFYDLGIDVVAGNC